MTALNQAAQIPSDIVTLEQMALWALTALNFINHNQEFQLSDDQPLQAVISASHFNDGAGQRRIGFTTYLSANPIYDYDKSAKLWMRANEISTAIIPVGFTTN